MHKHQIPVAPLAVHVLAHSHWDREWYHSAPRFRQRLVGLVEQLLQHTPDASRPFLLDGQAVVLDDVLRARPELRTSLEHALQSGALEAGPWYVLADELIPSGEALVRNLLAGRAVLESFGASAPPVCYSPDAFGHTAALPLLAQGFGLSVAVVWRGYGGARSPHGDTARWMGADGSSVLLWHLPPDGYEFGRMLPTSAEAAAERWQAISAALEPRSSTGVVLLTNGADHHALQPDLDVAVESLEMVASPAGHKVTRSSLGTWAQAFSAAAAQRAIPTVTGELRDSYGETWTLQGTFATRAHQKRAVSQADALLRYDVEPWVALACMAQQQNIDEQTRARSLGALTASDLALMLQHTWRTFLRVLPHDTLCGCSVDEVARALDHRLEVVRSEATALRDAAIGLLLNRDAVQARATMRNEWQPRLVLRNRSARQRYGVAEVELVQTLHDVAVGPGSGQAHGTIVSATELEVVGLVLQPLGMFDRYERRESPQHYPDNDRVRVTRALTWIPREHELDGFALRTLRLREVLKDEAKGGAAVDNEVPRLPEATPVPPVPQATVTRRGRTATLDNDSLSLKISARNIELSDLLNNRRIKDLVQLTWQADRGDTYTAAPRGRIRTLQPVRARIIAHGPMRAGVAVTYALRVSMRPFTRQNKSTVVRVTLRFFLDAGAPFLRVHVAGSDNACDHRLRIAFATGIRDGQIIADAAFGPVLRVPLNRADIDETNEHVTTSAPLHRWVAAASDRLSTTIISDGLAEYEPLKNNQLAVTLVRATGALSRASLPERPGHAGWPAPVPQAQGPGRFAARFAIAPGAAFDAAIAHNQAEDALLPLAGYTWRDAPPNAPEHVSGVTLAGEPGVVASAVKPAENGDGIVLRCVNVHEAARSAQWTTPWADARMAPARLDETTIAHDHETPAGSNAETPAVQLLPSPNARFSDATVASLILPTRAVSTLRVTRH